MAKANKGVITSALVTYNGGNSTMLLNGSSVLCPMGHKPLIRFGQMHLSCKAGSVPGGVNITFTVNRG